MSQPNLSNQESDGLLKEKLAAIEHERWADWQAWCHQVLREYAPSEVMETVLARWDKQIATPYDKLSDAEKASDMEQVARYWPLIQEYITASNRTLLEKIREGLPEKFDTFQPGIITIAKANGFNEAIDTFNELLDKVEGEAGL